jgi:hypothetical protein
MKFAAPILLLGLALSTTAKPVAKRSGDLQVFLGIISTIQDQTNALDSAINAYTGGDGADVQSASTQLVTVINDGVISADGQDVLSFADALTLATPVSTLADHVTTTVDDTIAKKDLFVQNCLGPTVLTDLQDQYKASTDLATAITAKVPDSVKAIAAQLAGEISTAIQNGVTAYTGVEGC